VELDGGGVIGFEIKTGNRVPGEQLKALKKLRDAVGANLLGESALIVSTHDWWKGSGGGIVCP
jgi:hypothetical protein